MFAPAVLLNFGIRGLGEQLRDSHSNLQYTTSIIGTCVSGFFLFLIAAFNIVILAGILRVFRGMRSGGYDDEQLEEQLNKRGLMNRFLGPLARDLPAAPAPAGALAPASAACWVISGSLRPRRHDVFADALRSVKVR